MPYDGLAWTILMLAPLLLVQRGLHREIQSVLLLLTRRVEITMALFSLLFLPGVILHEGSHWLMARLLGVRTGSISLIPVALPEGRVRLGYVETASADPLRDALIGVAPLLAGGAFVAYVGLVRLDMLLLSAYLQAGGSAVVEGMLAVYAMPDFWLWFYLTLTISSMMMPSASDRRAWRPVILAVILLFGLSLLAGAGPWLVEHLAEPLNRALRALALVLAISTAVQAVLLIPTWLVRRLLNHLTGLEVQ